MANELIDRTAWEKWKKLEAEGNPGFFLTLLQAFLETAPTLLESLLVGCHNHDVKIVRHNAHSLRSNCETLGLYTISRALFTVESQARDRSFIDTKAINKIADDLRAALDELQEEQKKLAA